jgi:hypothetical protein
MEAGPGRDFSLHYCVLTGPGALPASYLMGKRFFFLELSIESVKLISRSTTKMKNSWSFILTLPYIFSAQTTLRLISDVKCFLFSFLLNENK